MNRLPLWELELNLARKPQKNYVKQTSLGLGVVGEAGTFIHRSHPSLVEFVSGGMNSLMSCLCVADLVSTLEKTLNHEKRQSCLS